MTLRKKSFLIVVGTAIVLLVALYLAGRRIILDSALGLERESLTLDVLRVSSVLEAESNRLASAAGDWATWDDTYEFVAAGSPAFVAENLTDAALRTLDVGAMVFLDDAGRIVAEKIVRPAGAGERSGLAQALAAAVVPRAGAGWLGAGRSGLVALEAGAFHVAARPILRSDRSGPARGIVLFAQPLDIHATTSVARVVHVGAALRPLEDPALPTAVRSGLERLSETDPVLVVPLGFRVVAGYALLEDIAGKPSLVVELAEMRSIYVQGVHSLTYFVGALGFAVLCCVLLMTLLLERLVLSRLFRLGATVHRIGGAPDPSLRVEVEGADEISVLGAEVNAMLERLQEAHGAARRAHTELEERVRERTAELESVNTLLRAEIRERYRVEEELRRLKEGLERQNSELRSLDRMKDALIGDVSHELRTPVAKQAMQLELLRGELERRGIAEELGGPLRVMEAAVRRQQSVIRNILTISRMEAGGRGVRLDELRLDELLGEILEDYRETLSGCGIAVSRDVPPITLRTDRELLWHVFSNLVSNAVKYRRRVGPRVDVTAASEGGRVRVRVADNGVGFSPETRERLFERFYQESASVEGIGLGLHIVRTVLGKIGGEVTVDSPGRDRGTVAEVVLPLVAPGA